MTIAPYYADESVSLYHGDCLELLPAVCPDGVDHCLTDPPYEAEAHTKARRCSSDKWSHGGIAEEHKIDFSPIDQAARKSVSAFFGTHVRRWALVFCQVEAVAVWREALVDGGLEWIRGQAWVKPDGTPQFTGDRPAQGFECIATAHAPGRKRWNGGGSRGVYTYTVNGGAWRERVGVGHPTQKPLDLMTELVRLFTDPGDLILDPFAGSGTTGLAARLEGRRSILIEREERYCDVAARRLERMPREAKGQTALFGEGG